MDLSLQTSIICKEDNHKSILGEPHRILIGLNSSNLGKSFTLKLGWNWVHPCYMSDGILYWLSFPFSKQEATKSTGLSPAVNLSGLQPGLSRQSLLNGQKSFPGSRADLVLFRSFISQFMPNQPVHQWKRKQAKSFVLPCLPKHFFRIFLICLFFEYLAQHFDIRSWTGAQ